MGSTGKTLLVLSRITTYERLLERHGEQGLRELGRRGDDWFDKLLQAHEEHQETIDAIRSAVDVAGVKARFVTSMEDIDTSRYEAVVTAGGDGTVLYASHHVDATPMLGVRSSRHSAGYLTGATAEDFAAQLRKLLAGTLSSTTLHRMSVLIDGVVAHDRVLNEALFSHPNPAVTTRYLLSVDDSSEQQMSSGIWVGPAAGSTAAIRAAGGRVLSPSSRNIQWVVREPIRRPGTRFTLLRGLVRPGRELVIDNKWQPARLYLDGPHLTVSVEPAQQIRMRLSDSPLELLGWSKRRSRRRR
jgi:NAD+ kinase